MYIYCIIFLNKNYLDIDYNRVFEIFLSFGM